MRISDWSSDVCSSDLYFAQGACMAMADAVALSVVFEKHSGDVEEALGSYAKMRMLRTARVQLQSRWIGDNIYHPAESDAQPRNSIMRSYTAQPWYDALDWIYGANGLSGEDVRAIGGKAHVAKAELEKADA